MLRYYDELPLEDRVRGGLRVLELVINERRPLDYIRDYFRRVGLIDSPEGFRRIMSRLAEIFIPDEEPASQTQERSAQVLAEPETEVKLAPNPAMVAALSETAIAASKPPGSSAEPVPVTLNGMAQNIITALSKIPEETDLLASLGGADALREIERLYNTLDPASERSDALDLMIRLMVEGLDDQTIFSALNTNGYINSVASGKLLVGYLREVLIEAALRKYPAEAVDVYKVLSGLDRSELIETLLLVAGASREHRASVLGHFGITNDRVNARRLNEAIPKVRALFDSYHRSITANQRRDPGYPSYLRVKAVINYVIGVDETSRLRSLRVVLSDPRIVEADKIAQVQRGINQVLVIVLNHAMSTHPARGPIIRRLVTSTKAA